MTWAIYFLIVFSSLKQTTFFVDSLDILSTINVDTDIENERDNAMVLATILLIQSLRKNGDITKQVEDKSISTFNARVKDLDKRLENDFLKQLELIYKALGRKNKVLYSISLPSLFN